MMSLNKAFVLIWIIYISFSLSSQNNSVILDTRLPEPKTHRPTIPGYNTPLFPQTPAINHYAPSDVQQRNAAVVREVEQFEAYLNRQKTEEEMYADYLIKKGFPFQGNNPDVTGTEHYYNAFDTIHMMLDGVIPLHLGKAIFLVENAYYGGMQNYSDYEKALKSKADFCFMVMKEEKLDIQDNMAKNMMLFRLITDTIGLSPKGTEKTYTSYPVLYDLEDSEAKINYDSQFVTKLIRTNEGQCNSMPLYYLALAEQIGAEAYWAFSPRHSLVKIKDDAGAWFNLELTNGYLTSDEHYMNSGFIKAEALQKKTYLEPMDRKQIIGQLLNDLSHSYIRKYGYDHFVLYCSDLSKKYCDRDLNALMMESDYYTQLTHTIAYLLDAKNPEMLKAKSPQAYRYHEKMVDLYQQIDDTGYEDMPDEIYQSWRGYVEKLKEEEEKQGTRIRVK